MPRFNIRVRNGLYLREGPNANTWELRCHQDPMFRVLFTPVLVEDPNNPNAPHNHPEGEVEVDDLSDPDPKPPEDGEVTPAEEAVLGAVQAEAQAQGQDAVKAGLEAPSQEEEPPADPSKDIPF